jgi:hypothetical protein
MSQESRPKPFDPRGAIDGIVCDTALAKKMSFIGKFGASCDIGFNKDEFCKKHRQYEKFCPYLLDRPTQPWTEFTIHDSKSKDKEEDEEKEDKKKKEEEEDEEEKKKKEEEEDEEEDEEEKKKKEEEEDEDEGEKEKPKEHTKKHKGGFRLTKKGRKYRNKTKKIKQNK